MLFNSSPFIFVYLPIVFFGFFLIAHFSHQYAALWLCVVSLFFYGWWNPVYVLLLLSSIVCNFALAYQIGLRLGNNKGRQLLTVAVVANIALLGYFKYADFFLSITNSLSGANYPLLHIVLPLGISFFTFTQITFLVDVYRGLAKADHFIHYVLFVTYFPHLIAGPVLHHKQMMPQFCAASTYQINVANIAEGMTLFLIGLAKKVVLANSLGNFVGPVFSAAQAGQTITLIDGWLGALCFTFQLYFDFSGYSDMAIGLSLMFGVTLPINFNSPYQATNIIEFWKRWHITLSSFLRDYLYFSLGGNRRGPRRRYANLMITMVLGGLWHGANWTFVVWGGIHGCYLIINHFWQSLHPIPTGQTIKPTSIIARSFSILLTFIAVVIGWVFFRAETWATAHGILLGMAGMNGITLPGQIVDIIPFIAPYVTVTGVMATLGASSVIGCFEQLILVMIAAFICFFLPNTQQMSCRSKRFAIMLSAGFIVQSLFFSGAPSEFLYFQF